MKNRGGGVVREVFCGGLRNFVVRSFALGACALGGMVGAWWGDAMAQPAPAGQRLEWGAPGPAAYAGQSPAGALVPFMPATPSLGAASPVTPAGQPAIAQPPITQLPITQLPITQPPITQLSGSALPGAGFSEMGQGTGPASAAAQRPASAVLQHNQFQRFVHSTTGQDLPLHGYKLFDSERFAPLANVPAPAHYVLGPGDEVDLKIWGAVDWAMRLTVDRNGQITLPKVGPVTVAGTRAEHLERQLTTQVARVFNNFELSATLGRLRSIQVYVVGQARKPGAYTVSGLSTLISALFESGGPAATGSMRRIALVREGKTLTTLDLYDFIHSGSVAQDAPLLSGDVIVIPPAGPRVAVLGALDNPAVYELRQAQESLQSVLAYSGGLHALTTPHQALLERINPSQAQAPRSVQEQRLDASGLQTLMRDGDVLTLFPIAPQFSNAVTLRGNVQTPVRHSFTPGMRVADLIPEPSALIQRDYYQRKNSMVQFESGKAVSAERVAQEVRNLLDEINWDYAVIERLDAQDIKTVLIPFNLGKAIKQHDPAHNLPLQAGDVVTVFGVNDLPVPLEKRNPFVRVAGEVMVPGMYALQPGETLARLIQRAGGLSRNAFLYGTVFTRETTRQQQQANLDKAARRLEADIHSQTATLAQNTSDADKASVQAQFAAQKNLLERVRNLRASGRISLEMDALQPVVPELVLEDGDSIVIPSTPSFVGVFGAVLAETSFIYKANASVADYLEKAGPSREADLDATLLIRADGSVLTNKAHRNWLGWGNSQFLRTALQPGDSLFVPELIDRRTAYTQFIQGAKDWSQLVYQFGLGAAGLKTLRN